MKLRYLLVIVISIFCHWSELYAQPNAPQKTKISLDEAISLAFENNAELLNLRNASLIAKSQTSKGYNGYMPLVFLESGYNTRNEDVNQRFVTGQEQIRNNAITSQLNASIGLDYVLYSGFRNKHQQSSARTNLNLISAQVKALENNVENQVTSLYYQLVSSQQLNALYLEALRLSKLKLEIAQLKLSIGRGSKPELLTAQTNYFTDSVQWIENLANQNALNLDFSNLINPKDWIIYTPKDTVISINRNLEIDITKSSELETYKQDLTLKANNLNIVSSGLQPTITLNGRYNFSTINSQAGFLESSRTNGYTAGVGLRWNLFDGLKQSINTQIAFINLKNAQINYDAAQSRLSRQYLSLTIQYNSYIRLLDVLKDAIAVAKENVELSQELYKSGRSDIIFVREAELNYIQSQQNFLTYQLKVKNLELQIINLGR